ncbi:M23 family metallopeptidase [Pseudescherichia sp.]|uniref:M23 family metallopeptidase n=1 Tax=Pseudescherichia sp. TaxID=2055881 RepID=UPI0028A18EF3|nr:M23 family metallopeptidase [Pseudescherichia sp.]
MPLRSFLLFFLVSLFSQPGYASLPLQKAVAMAPRQPVPLFSWPLTGSLRVTSPFGMRFHPLAHTFLKHEGVDLRAPTDSEVRVIADGRVAETGYGPLTGFFITVDHADGWRSRYLHLNTIQVHKSEQLKQGTVIALSGATGRTTGPHLHLELSHHQQAIDPVSMLATSPGSPIASAAVEKPVVTPEVDLTPTITLVSGEGDTLQIGVRIGNKTTFYSLKEPVEQGDDVWRIVRRYGKYKLVKVNPQSSRR